MTPRRTAVLFDLGGVVLRSPLHFIAAFEEREGLPPGIVARAVGGYQARPDGAWQRLERGELPFTDFCAAFDDEIRALGAPFSSAKMMREMAEVTAVVPEMLTAIRTLRAAGLRVGALTNNWAPQDDRDDRMDALRPEFDAFVESWRVGMRKPDPQIYRLALEQLGAAAEETVFLDDIGHNLKPARALGMETIKVTEPSAALAALSDLVGVEFRATG